MCDYFIFTQLPCCALVLFCAYPAVPLFSLTLLCPPFSTHLPAVPLLFCALTLLCPNFYFAAHFPCSALILLRNLAKDIEEEEVEDQTPFQPLEAEQDFP